MRWPHNQAGWGLGGQTEVFFFFFFPLFKQLHYLFILFLKKFPFRIWMKTLHFRRGYVIAWYMSVGRRLHLFRYIFCVPVLAPAMNVTLRNLVQQPAMGTDVPIFQCICILQLMPTVLLQKECERLGKGERLIIPALLCDICRYDLHIIIISRRCIYLGFLQLAFNAAFACSFRKQEIFY